MTECDHDNRKPYVYGYMTSEFIKQSWDGQSYYGGLKNSDGLPAFFCPDCLEDLFE